MLREHGVDQVKHEAVETVPHTAEFDIRSVILCAIAEESPDVVAVGARHRRHPRAAGRVGVDCGRSPRTMFSPGGPDR